jgi:hypothetical protein
MNGADLPQRMINRCYSIQGRDFIMDYSDLAHNLFNEILSNCREDIFKIHLALFVH